MEQGHPISPELFKCFVIVHRLSEELNDLDDMKVPVLNSVRITHLLWVDDLVLLALTPLSLQRMLNTLHSYCMEWGLSVNIAKTAVKVFNRTGRLLNESNSFFYGETRISPAREYTYLAIVFTLSGSFKTAQANLSATEGSKGLFLSEKNGIARLPGMAPIHEYHKRFGGLGQTNKS